MEIVVITALVMFGLMLYLAPVQTGSAVLVVAAVAYPHLVTAAIVALAAVVIAVGAVVIWREFRDTGLRLVTRSA